MSTKREVPNLEMSIVDQGEITWTTTQIFLACNPDELPSVQHMLEHGTATIPVHFGYITIALPEVSRARL